MRPIKQMSYAECVAELIRQVRGYWIHRGHPHRFWGFWPLWWGYCDMGEGKSKITRWRFTRTSAARALFAAARALEGK